MSERICESSVLVSINELQVTRRKQTRSWIVLQQLEQLDEDPRTRHLVIKVALGTFIVDNYPLQPVCSLGVASFVLLRIVLDKGCDEGGDGEGNTHVRVIHEGYYPFGPLVLHNCRMFPVEPQKCERCLLLDECLGSPAMRQPIYQSLLYPRETYGEMRSL